MLDQNGKKFFFLVSNLLDPLHKVLNIYILYKIKIYKLGKEGLFQLPKICKLISGLRSLL